MTGGGGGAGVAAGTPAGGAAAAATTTRETARSGSTTTSGLLTVHVALGLTILALAVARVLWRRHAGLPPWAETLSRGERFLAHWTERAMLILLFVIPLTGLWLVLVSDDAVGVHVASHIAFYVALAAHIGLVLKHQFVNRDDLLGRMT